MNRLGCFRLNSCRPKSADNDDGGSGASDPLGLSTAALSSASAAATAAVAPPSAMKVRTLDESLHLKTLSGARSARRAGPKNPGLGWHLVEIREYCRNIGDNPSVSCGPPLS